MKPGVTRSNYRGAHRYSCSIHGVSGLPGVTTLMKAESAEGLEYWKRDQLLRMVFERLDGVPAMLEGDGLDATLKYFHAAGRTAGRDKRDIGSDVHAWVEDFVKGKAPVVPGHIARHVEGFQRWFTDNAPEVKASEFIVVSETERYGGTGDLAFVMGGEFWGVDVKTGKLLAETGMQLAALRWADHAGREGDPNEYQVPQTTKHGVLLVHEDGTELVPFDIRPDREFKRFLANRDIYELKKSQDEVFAA